ncbi:MAG: hypothetical protein Q4Q07_04465 [Tissierellia bacterium]|nr:hypothetical protein [Tissierellia bacterium]
MLITFLLAIMMMAGLFVLLWAGIGLIQNKRFFSTAPSAVIEVVSDKKERFQGQHILGYLLGIVAMSLMIGAIILGAINGVRNGYTFHQLFSAFSQYFF